MKLVQRAIMQGVIFGSLVVCGAVLPALKVHAAQQTQSYSVTINSQVVGPPPSTPPSIDTPADGTSFDQKQVEVKGTCITDLIVKIFRNNLFAGSALCATDGTYSLTVDLVEARNDLVARQYDTANQASPDSDTVTVYYIPPAEPVVPRENQSTSQTTSNTTSTPTQSSGSAQTGTGNSTAPFQLVINYQYSLQAIFPGQSFQLPVTFTGGTPPYAINIDWGDGKSDLYSRSDASSFNVNHAYANPGFYTIKIKVSDKNGKQAVIQFVLIVNGSATEAFINNALTSNEPRFVAIRVAAGALIVASWIGAFVAGGAFQFHKFKIIRRK